MRFGTWLRESWEGALFVTTIGIPGLVAGASEFAHHGAGGSIWISPLALMGVAGYTFVAFLMFALLVYDLDHLPSVASSILILPFLGFMALCYGLIAGLAWKLPGEWSSPAERMPTYVVGSIALIVLAMPWLATTLAKSKAKRKGGRESSEVGRA